MWAVLEPYFNLGDHCGDWVGDCITYMGKCMIVSMEISVFSFLWEHKSVLANSNPQQKQTLEDAAVLVNCATDDVDMN